MNWTYIINYIIVHIIWTHYIAAIAGLIMFPINVKILEMENNVQIKATHATSKAGKTNIKIYVGI